MSDLIDRQAAIDTLDIGAELLRRVLDITDIVGAEREKYKWGLELIESYISDMKALPSAQQWIPCGEKLPEEYGEYQITWTTSYAPSKRFIGDSEYEVTSVWDEERNTFKGEWLLDAYIQAYPDVKVIAWMPLPEPYRIPQSETE